MLERVAYGTLAIAILLGLFLLDAVIAALAKDLAGPFGQLLQRGSVVPLVVLGIILVAVVELSHMLRRQGARPYVRFACVVVAVLVLSPWLSAAGWLGRSAAQIEGLYWQIAWLIATFVGVGAIVVTGGDPAGAMRDAASTLLIILYLGFLGSFASQIRCARDAPEGAGVWLLLAIILICKASDIGAYFAGSLMGRHKLAPALSPAKSIEGAIAGIASSMAVAVLLLSLMPAIIGPAARTDPVSDPFGLLFTAQLLLDSRSTYFLTLVILLGAVVSFSGQLGDLLESSFKRDSNIKDSGDLIPRFGGILDLIDSPVLAIPVAWFWMTGVMHIV